jgi:hypothetical protein
LQRNARSTEVEEGASFAQRDTESTGFTGTRSIGDAADAGFHGGHSEVHQKPKARVHDLQAGEQLAMEHRVQRPSGFDFDDVSVVDDQIRPTSV